MSSRSIRSSHPYGRETIDEEIPRPSQRPIPSRREFERRAARAANPFHDDMVRDSRASRLDEVPRAGIRFSDRFPVDSLDDDDESDRDSYSPRSGRQRSYGSQTASRTHDDYTDSTSRDPREGRAIPRRGAIDLGSHHLYDISSDDSNEDSDQPSRGRPYRSTHSRACARRLGGLPRRGYYGSASNVEARDNSREFSRERSSSLGNESEMESDIWPPERHARGVRDGGARRFGAHTGRELEAYDDDFESPGLRRSYSLAGPYTARPRREEWMVQDDDEYVDDGGIYTGYPRVRARE